MCRASLMSNVVLFFAWFVLCLVLFFAWSNTLWTTACWIKQRTPPHCSCSRSVGNWWWLLMLKFRLELKKPKTMPSKISVGCLYSLDWTTGLDYTACALHSFYPLYWPYLLQLRCSNPQHNLLSMHINMHYTPMSTIQASAFHHPLMHTNWQNGTSCRDGVKVLWCRSHLVCLHGFWGFHPYTCLFSFRKLFCDFY